MLYCTTLKVKLLLDSGDIEMLESMFRQVVRCLLSVFPRHAHEFFSVKHEKVPALLGGKVYSTFTSIVVNRNLVPNNNKQVHAVTLASDCNLFKKKQRLLLLESIVSINTFILLKFCCMQCNVCVCVMYV